MFDYLFKFQQMVAEWIAEFFYWHEDKVQDFVEKYDLTVYQTSWLGFIKGILLVIILQWLFWYGINYFVWLNGQTHSSRLLFSIQLDD